MRFHKGNGVGIQGLCAALDFLAKEDLEVGYLLACVGDGTLNSGPLTPRRFAGEGLPGSKIGPFRLQDRLALSTGFAALARCRP